MHKANRFPFTRRSSAIAAAAILMGGALPGCGLVGRSLIRASRTPETDSQPPVDLKSRIQNDTPVSRLSPFVNGPGVVICNPVTSSDLRNFAQGAGGWLNLAVAGQPKFSRTPALGNLQRACQELSSPVFAVESASRADRLSGILGATEVAVGTLTGTKDHCKLTYHLYKIPSNRPIGTPVTAEGSMDQITAQLPGIALKMAKSLGAAHPDIPTSTGLTAADLEFLGPLTLADDFSDLTQPQQTNLQSLAAHSPLATIVSLRSVRSTPAAGPAASLLISQAPANPLALSEVAIDNAEALIPHTDLIKKDTIRFSDNYLFNLTSAWLYRTSKQMLQERKAAEATMQSAPGSPDAWLTLGYSISNEAQEVRRSKAFREMSDSEQAFVSNLYPDWASCSSHATQLDPFYGKAWLRLATSSCFAGDPATADSAFWQAAKLDPDKADVYAWGLQMYQSKKWRSGDEQKLVNIAQMAASGFYAKPADVDRVAAALDDAGFADAKSALLAKYGRPASN